jgi:hypothetical protein
MNTFVATAYRNLLCLVAAALISLVAGLGFAQATAVPPGSSAATVIIAPRA